MGELIVCLDQWQEMLYHVKSCLPEEACGLIAGIGSRVLKVYPATNQAHSTRRFQMDPQQQLETLEEIDRNQLDLLAIYHSHPQGPSHPSRQDITEYFYPGSQYLIWYPSGNNWDCCAFLIRGDHYEKSNLIRAE